ncbi:MAG: polysaccharide deacetylase family protein [Bacteroidales bacterium]|nr:polysaccharide deacetylase family protein [Bacteroidales bacterium]
MSRLTVVMYHYVRDLSNSRYPKIKGLDFSLFIGQIKYLLKNYSFIKMEDLIDSIYNNKQLPSNAVLLTFDDAYIDHYLNVFPVLDYYQIQGSFFAPVKAITEHEVLDVNKVHFILASANEKDIIDMIKGLLLEIKNEPGIYGFSHYYETLAKPTRFDSKDVIFIKRLLQHALPKASREKTVNELFEKFVGIEESTFSRELYMNEYHYKTMLKHGMHIGGHGYDHYWMDKLTKEAQTSEVLKTKNFLSALGVDEDYYSYCYPYGSHNNDTINILKSNGFKCAFTTDVNTINIKENYNQFTIPRLDTNDLPKGEH